MPAVEGATRVVYWHIAPVWPVYALLTVALAVFGYGVYRRARLWRALGEVTPPLGQPLARLARIWSQIGLHKRFRREGVAGWMHAAILWGMVLLLAGTIVVMLRVDFGVDFMRGWFYLVFQKLALSVAGAFLGLACAIALWRRYVAKVPRVQPNRAGVAVDRSDVLSPLLLLLIVAQGFALQGIRLAAKPDPFSLWSPVGHGLSLGLAGLAEPTLVLAYQVTWWFHLVTVLAWIAWLPYGKMLHVLTGPLNVYASRPDPLPPVPQAIDFEKADHLGVSRIGHFSWKDLLDLDACTSCGRCQQACPAFAAGAPLSPRNLILDLRDHMRTHGPRLVDQPDDAGEVPALVGGTIREDTLWACTSCAACMEECPVHIEHVPKISGMRRHLVMEESRLPRMLQDAMKSLEDRSHPYKGVSGDRTEWSKGLDLPLATDTEDYEILYWVGCTASFDPRSQKVARSFVELLKRAGVKVAVLGKAEACCGDPARRVGHEFLYEQSARANIELLQSVRPRRIATACPHCLNALGKEYRQFGGSFEVIHHSQLLDELVQEGRLRPHDSAGAGKVTYHDPCYLGRYGGEYEAPRRLVDEAGAQRVEMARSRSASHCCGGGGGHAFAASAPQPGVIRINEIRAKQALDTGADTLAVSCPFCMRMMEDGVKSVDGGGKVKVRDVAEVLLEAVTRSAPAAASAETGSA